MKYRALFFYKQALIDLVTSDQCVSNFQCFHHFFNSTKTIFRICVIVIRSRKLCYTICVAANPILSLFHTTESLLSFSSPVKVVFLLPLNDVFVTKVKSLMQVTSDSSGFSDGGGGGGRGGGHKSIVLKEGKGKATSSAVAMGTMGVGEKKPHTQSRMHWMEGGRVSKTGPLRLKSRMRTGKRRWRQ